MFNQPHRDEVFVAGGQPSYTYVDRDELHVERNLARALATPNQIVSLSAPTKTGKTVLCRRVLGNREYVWIDGGQNTTAGALWNTVCNELNVPLERSRQEGLDYTQKADVNAVVITAGGSRLERVNTTTTYKLSSLTEALSALLERRIVLVVDDFHYIEKDSRTEFMRNVKGAVYAGLKILLLSVTHRAFDAIKAESELTGRFTSVSLPKWTNHDLLRIPELGFEALKTKYSKKLIERLAREAQDSPFLMQTFCWELCFDSGIEKPKFVGYNTIPDDYDVEPMFIRIAENAGLPIYQRLVAGPQSRKIRQKRPLRNGDEADIYEATLIALAETGPKASVKYDELRATLNTLLVEMMPQKHEITSALKHLARISFEAGTESAIDWDEEKREVNIADPYLRFFLRWQVRWRDGAS